MRPTKNFLLAVGAVLVMAACGWFTWQQQFAAPKINVALHQGIGEALAAEVIHALENRGDLLVITMADRDSEILAAQFAAFRNAIQKAGGIRIKDVELIDSDKKDKYGPGLGLSASKLAREVKKNSKKSAIVSFVGLPKLEDEEFAALGARVPPLFVFSRDRDKLSSLLKRQAIQAAIVPRYQFPAPGPEKPRTPREWFVNQYQLIRPAAQVTGR
ncbi:MAG: hypothetical protein KJ070_07390 [Verrucomicrobia bacterium]|nr:hypothetical protein [Verrucomicrobiota bacterium]